MDKRQSTGELFPDTDAIRRALERRTRDALLRRLGPTALTPTNARTGDATPPAVTSPAVLPQLFGFDPAERLKARGIGFGVDLVRAILDGRKTQTRRVVRPHPATPPDAKDCPAARPGELLHVREPWLRTHDADGVRFRYAADEIGPISRGFRPGMYMARAAARLWLRVRTVRVERLQAISDADVVAEGLPPGRSLASVWDGFYTDAGERYNDDPWVWVIAFDVEPG